MTEAPSADPVDPEQLLRAFLVMTEDGPPDDDASQNLTASEASDIVARIQSRLGTEPDVTTDLFRRCCAMANLFADAANRMLVGIDDAKPDPAVWLAAASAPVHQVTIDGLDCDTYDPQEFAAAVRQYRS
jgi:hypothetical protein